MSPQKSRTSQPLEPPPVRPATEPAGGTTGTQDLAARLANALKREGDRESAFQFRERTYWRPVAERILADTELLDAIVAHRQGAERRFTARQVQDAVMAVLDLDTHEVRLWLRMPQDTTTPCGSLHPEDAGHVARWVAETLNPITEEPTE